MKRAKVVGSLYEAHVPEGSVYVGRRGPGLKGHVLCNPHRAGKPCRVLACEKKVHTLDECLDLYRDRLKNRPHLLTVAKEIAAQGLDFACWCKITNSDGAPIRCHVDVIIELLNEG